MGASSFCICAKIIWEGPQCGVQDREDPSFLTHPVGAFYLRTMPLMNQTAEFFTGCAFGALAVAVVWFVWTI